MTHPSESKSADRPERRAQQDRRSSSDRRAGSQRSRTWTALIVVSFAFSAIVLCWAFTVPFRDLGAAKNLKISPSQQAKLQIMGDLSPAEYREQAIDQHHEMVQRIREKNEEKSRLHAKSFVSPAQLKAKRQAKTSKLKARLARVQAELDADETLRGTILWSEREYLVGLLEDSSP